MDGIEDLLVVERVLALAMRDQRQAQHLARFGLTAGDFPTAEHGNVWSAVLRVADKHGAADPALVESVLARDMGAAAAREWVRDIVRNGAAVVDDETLTLYVERLRQQAGRRRIVTLADRLYQEAKSEREVGVIIGDAVRTLEQIAAGASTRGPVSAKLLADRYVKALDGSGAKVLRVTTGIPAIDSALNGGGRVGLVMAVGAQTGVGKTTIGQHMLLAAATQVPAAYFSLETRSDAFFESLVAMHARRRFRARDDDWSRTAGALGELSDLPVFVDDNEGQTAEEIAGKITALARDNGVRVVFIDYVQDIERSTRHQRDDQNYAHISKVLRRAAGRAGVFLVEMSQVNDPDEPRRGGGGKEPTSEKHLSYTQQWGKDAAYVVMLDRKKHADGAERHITRVRLTKNRPDMELATTWLRYIPDEHRLMQSDERGEEAKPTEIVDDVDAEWEEVMGGRA